MVWSRECDADERPPVSVILPRLYLGAERDVTQDGLASRGISYVLSVSRSSPQPSFLPRSRHLRIPIDDSLWADLLPWIPQALRFIDSAISSGASVLVHCAAGISRSPALAVAYVMYSLGMDLDHAYRFVKERRPTISPNFNFLGQLQQFQGTLTQKTPPGGETPTQQQQQQQQEEEEDGRLPPFNDNLNHSRHGHNLNSNSNSEHAQQQQQRQSCPVERGNLQLHLSAKLKTFHLNLNQNQQQRVASPCRAPAPAPSPLREPARPVARPSQLHLPTSPRSLVEKRKSLTLSLTPLGGCPRSPTSGISTSTSTSTSSSSRRVTNSAAPRVGQSKARRNSGSCGRSGEEEQAKEAGLMSPFSFSLNKLLDWGERVLLGGVLVHPVRMGQPALPYRC